MYIFFVYYGSKYIPYVFTSTAHIVVPFGMSLSIMIAVTLLGILTFKTRFFSILVPVGCR